MEHKERGNFLKTLGMAMLILCLLSLKGVATAEPRRLSVVIFPVENHTGLEIWQSKYYPYSVLEQKMNEYFATLFLNSPLIDVKILDEPAMNRWISAERRLEDMAIQLELYSATLKEREMMGTIEKGRVNLRIKIFDAANAEQFSTRTSSGKDSRFTFSPGEENLFWINQMGISLPIPFKEGFDLLQLTRTPDKGQKMSRLTWQQFSTTSHWQAIKNAINEGYHVAMGQVSNAIRRNDPTAQEEGRDSFSPSFTMVGRIIAPTAESTRRRREYIVSLGRQNEIRVGDILDVVRSDTYVTVDPEHPVVVMPKTIGQVRVVSVQDGDAVVRVTRNSSKNPIQLKDLVIKTIGPRS